MNLDTVKKLLDKALKERDDGKLRIRIEIIAETLGDVEAKPNTPQTANQPNPYTYRLPNKTEKAQPFKLPETNRRQSNEVSLTVHKGDNMPS